MKEQSKTFGLHTLVTWVALIPVLWFIGKPLMVATVSEAMAADVKEIVVEQNAPIKSAFTVLLTRDINSLRKEIAALRFRQRNDENWEAIDATYLEDLQIELEALKEAREELNGEIR